MKSLKGNFGGRETRHSCKEAAWCHSLVKTVNGCISVGGDCHGPADVS